VQFNILIKIYFFIIGVKNRSRLTATSQTHSASVVATAPGLDCYTIHRKAFHFTRFPRADIFCFPHPRLLPTDRRWSPHVFLCTVKELARSFRRGVTVFHVCVCVCVSLFDLIIILVYEAGSYLDHRYRVLPDVSLHRYVNLYNIIMCVCVCKK